MQCAIVYKSMYIVHPRMMYISKVIPVINSVSQLGAAVVVAQTLLYQPACYLYGFRTCIVYSVQQYLYSVQCTAVPLQCTVYSSTLTVYTVQHYLYSVYGTTLPLQCTAVFIV